MLTKLNYTIRKVWSYISVSRRYHIFFLLVLTILGGLFEIVSIGAIVPFLSVLLAPEKALEYQIFNDLAVAFQVQSQSDLITFLTFIFLSAITISALLRGLLLWLNIRVSHAIGADFEKEVYRRNLYQPYEVHIQRNVSSVTSCVLKTGAVTTIILAALNIVHGVIVTVFIVTGIMLINPYLSIGIFLTIGTIYLIVMWYTRSQLVRNGREIADNTSLLLKWMQESLGGIRDILLEGRQKQYSDYFGQVSVDIKRAAGSNLLIGQGPRLVVEPIGMIVITLVACTSALSGNFAAQLPFLGALALAAQRLLPTVQQIYSGWSSINSSLPQVDDVFEILDTDIRDEFNLAIDEKLNFSDRLEFQNVRFSYQGSGRNVLNDVSFAIEKGQCVGIVGRSGSGKSTLLDLILGLLSPTDGDIAIDGKKLLGRTRQQWQRSLSHVPQDIYLNDTSIAENIAFGIDKKDIEFEKIEEAAKRAQLHDFISTLPEGYHTIVGERGKQLSGGQRQRIGIARALYKQTPVMIFDEATSALDHQTEQDVINEIIGKQSNVTLIIVTHRLQTLENCNVIHVVEDTRVIASGGYQEIMQKYDITPINHEQLDTLASYHDSNSLIADQLNIKTLS